MTTREEIRSQYTADDLEIFDRLDIDPPNLADLAENIALNCAPWQPADAPAAPIDEEDEEDEEDESDDSPTAFVDFRLKLRRSGYVLNVGSPDYDQDGRGPCGVASIRIDESNDPEKLAEVARELVDSALEEAAQGYSKKDIAA